MTNPRHEAYRLVVGAEWRGGPADIFKEIAIRSNRKDLSLSRHLCGLFLHLKVSRLEDFNG